jgi:hypothetical protein
MRRTAETPTERFTGGTDGSNPGPGLVSVDGVLYGTTAYEGGRQLLVLRNGL